MKSPYLHVGLMLLLVTVLAGCASESDSSAGASPPAVVSKAPTDASAPKGDTAAVGNSETAKVGRFKRP